MIIPCDEGYKLIKRVTNTTHSKKDLNWLLWLLMGILFSIPVIFALVKVNSFHKKEKEKVTKKSPPKSNKKGGFNEEYTKTDTPLRYNTIDMPDEPAPAYIP